ncbi:MAG: M1 family metallopeptidase [Bacteroidetes bacterium]|nr:M1 family metallopeptidase [Bacteroidota bacterium]
MQRSILISVFFFFVSFLSVAQYSRADSLRGALNPDRTCFDVHFYHLNISVDTAAKSIAGYNEIVFTVLNQTERIQLDLFSNMTIDSIVFHRLKLSYTREFNAVLVDFPGYLMQGVQEKVRVYYHGQPVQAKKAPWDGGFVWKKDKNGNPWIGVACEGIGASLWWPNKDHLSDEPDSMRISCEVPNGLQCISNGTLLMTQEGKKGTIFHWKVHYPINNYNVTLNIGNYVLFSEDYISGNDTLNCDYYVLPHNLEKAKAQFKQVKPMLAIYEDLFGRYPFWKDGYALVETPYLGMEHQGAISYGNKYMPGYMGHHPEGIDFDYIIIHESGHEYWGNSLSVKDLADMWIHEGFCTYTEALYVEKFYGYETAIKYLKAQLPGIDNDKPIIANYDVNEEGSNDRYPKGSWMLHTIRNLVNNDSLWFATIKGITTDFKCTNVDSKMIEKYMEKKLGVELTPVFDLYLRHKEIPVLKVEFEKSCRNVKLNCRMESVVDGFHLPVKYSVDGGISWKLLFSGSDETSFIVTKKEFKQIQFSNDLYLFKVEMFAKEKVKK